MSKRVVPAFGCEILVLVGSEPVIAQASVEKGAGLIKVKTAFETNFFDNLCYLNI